MNGPFRRTCPHLGDARPPTLETLSVTTLAVWTVATILGIVAPVFVTRSDPTQIPVAEFVAPVVAAMLTAFAGVIANVFERRASSDSAPR